jgi:diphosphomevalonate decarboxylase
MAVAHPNIAFIKYWGDLDPCLRIPSNGSLSMNLAGLETRTRVSFDVLLQGDHVTVNGQVMGGAGLERVSALLDRVREMACVRTFARVESENNFPMGRGPSSASVKRWH